jgi:galactose mutarotase-like enzyme
VTEINIGFGDWKLEIDLMGGRIKELRYGDKVVLGTYHRNDGKIANTHLCVPNFANEGVGKFQLPAHGPVRNGLWRVAKGNKNCFQISFEFQNVGAYPGHIEVQQKYRLEGNNLLHEIEVKNLGAKSPVNVGIHNYFEMPQGWKDLKINGENMNEKVKKSGYIALKPQNEIFVPGRGMMDWEIGGFQYSKLWVSEGDKNYVCIEPVRGREEFIENRESFLKSGETLKLYQKFGISGF